MTLRHRGIRRLQRILSNRLTWLLLGATSAAAPTQALEMREELSGEAIKLYFEDSVATLERPNSDARYSHDGKHLFMLDSSTRTIDVANATDLETAASTGDQVFPTRYSLDAVIPAAAVPVSIATYNLNGYVHVYISTALDGPRADGARYELYPMVLIDQTEQQERMSNEQRLAMHQVSTDLRDASLRIAGVDSIREETPGNGAAASEDIQYGRWVITAREPTGLASGEIALVRDPKSPGNDTPALLNIDHDSGLLRKYTLESPYEPKLATQFMLNAEVYDVQSDGTLEHAGLNPDVRFFDIEPDYASFGLRHAHEPNREPDYYSLISLHREQLQLAALTEVELAQQSLGNSWLKSLMAFGALSGLIDALDTFVGNPELTTEDLLTSYPQLTRYINEAQAHKLVDFAESEGLLSPEEASYYRVANINNAHGGLKWFIIAVFVSSAVEIHHLQNSPQLAKAAHGAVISLYDQAEVLLKKAGVGENKLALVRTRIERFVPYLRRTYNKNQARLAREQVALRKKLNGQVKRFLDIAEPKTPAEKIASFGKWVKGSDQEAKNLLFKDEVQKTETLLQKMQNIQIAEKNGGFEFPRWIARHIPERQLEQLKQLYRRGIEKMPDWSNPQSYSKEARLTKLKAQIETNRELLAHMESYDDSVRALKSIVYRRNVGPHAKIQSLVDLERQKRPFGEFSSGITDLFPDAQKGFSAKGPFNAAMNEFAGINVAADQLRFLSKNTGSPAEIKTATDRITAEFAKVRKAIERGQFADDLPLLEDLNIERMKNLLATNPTAFRQKMARFQQAGARSLAFDNMTGALVGSKDSINAIGQLEKAATKAHKPHLNSLAEVVSGSTSYDEAFANIHAAGEGVSTVAAKARKFDTLGDFLAIFGKKADQVKMDEILELMQSSLSTDKRALAKTRVLLKDWAQSPEAAKLLKTDTNLATFLGEVQAAARSQAERISLPLQRLSNASILRGSNGTLRYANYEDLAATLKHLEGHASVSAAKKALQGAEAYYNRMESIRRNIAEYRLIDGSLLDTINRLEARAAQNGRYSNAVSDLLSKAKGVASDMANDTQVQKYLRSDHGKEFAKQLELYKDLLRNPDQPVKIVDLENMFQVLEDSRTSGKGFKKPIVWQYKKRMQVIVDDIDALDNRWIKETKSNTQNKAFDRSTIEELTSLRTQLNRRLKTSTQKTRKARSATYVDEVNRLVREQLKHVTHFDEVDAAVTDPITRLVIALGRVYQTFGQDYKKMANRIKHVQAADKAGKPVSDLERWRAAVNQVFLETTGAGIVRQGNTLYSLEITRQNVYTTYKAMIGELIFDTIGKIVAFNGNPEEAGIGKSTQHLIVPGLGWGPHWLLVLDVLMNQIRWILGGPIAEAGLNKMNYKPLYTTGGVYAGGKPTLLSAMTQNIIKAQNPLRLARQQILLEVIPKELGAKLVEAQYLVRHADDMKTDEGQARFELFLESLNAKTDSSAYLNQWIFYYTLLYPSVDSQYYMMDDLVRNGVKLTGNSMIETVLRGAVLPFTSGFPLRWYNMMFSKHHPKMREIMTFYGIQDVLERIDADGYTDLNEWTPYERQKFMQVFLTLELEAMRKEVPFPTDGEAVDQAKWFAMFKLRVFGTDEDVQAVLDQHRDADGNLTLGRVRLAAPSDESEATQYLWAAIDEHAELLQNAQDHYRFLPVSEAPVAWNLTPSAWTKADQNHAVKRVLSDLIDVQSALGDATRALEANRNQLGRWNKLSVSLASVEAAGFAWTFFLGTRMQHFLKGLEGTRENLLKRTALWRHKNIPSGILSKAQQAMSTLKVPEMREAIKKLLNKPGPVGGANVANSVSTQKGLFKSIKTAGKRHSFVGLFALIAGGAVYFDHQRQAHVASHGAIASMLQELQEVSLAATEIVVQQAMLLKASSNPEETGSLPEIDELRSLKAEVDAQVLSMEQATRDTFDKAWALDRSKANRWGVNIQEFGLFSAAVSGTFIVSKLAVSKLFRHRIALNGLNSTTLKAGERGRAVIDPLFRFLFTMGVSSFIYGTSADMAHKGSVAVYSTEFLAMHSTYSRALIEQAMLDRLIDYAETGREMPTDWAQYSEDILADNELLSDSRVAEQRKYLICLSAPKTSYCTETREAAAATR